MRARKVDQNQKPLLKEARANYPYHIIVNSGAGNGLPDLIVPHNGFNFFFEVKVDDKSTLTKKQKEIHPIFHSNGQIQVIYSAQHMHEYIQNFKYPRFN